MTTLAAAFLSALLVVTPTSSAVNDCVVDDVQVSWGFKESFRSYLSGAIALGQWTVAGDISYETPLFGFSGGEGQVSPKRDGGEIDFEGEMRFVGHGGILNTSLSNPTLRFLGDREAALLFDVRGDTMDFVFVETSDVDFVRLSWSLFDETLDVRNGVWEVTDARVTLTPAGSGAFGTYLAGEVFDPLSFRVAVTPGCFERRFSWWWLPGGAVAIAAAGSALWFLTRRGRKSPEPEHQ